MNNLNSTERTVFHFAKRSALAKVLVYICATYLPLHANERVIKDCATCEALFTVQQIHLNNKKVLVIDRVIKGNVNAKIMALVQAGSQHSYTSKHLVFVVFPGVREIRCSPVDRFGRFKYEINGKLEICSLEDLMSELDESPQAAAARLKRDTKKAANTGQGNNPNRAAQDKASGNIEKAPEK